MTSPDDLTVGQELELDLGAPGHGGVTVARYEGRVVFVRFGAPGERVLVRLTEVRKGSFCRGDVVAVRRRSPDRVTAPCLHYGPAACGGCDLMHLSGPAQRSWKADVVAEQLRRLAGLELPVTVQALPGDGFGWRTRVRWAIDPGNAEVAPHIGPRTSKSHAVIPISAAEPCLIASPGLSEAAAALPAADLVPADHRRARSSHRPTRPQHRSGPRAEDRPEVSLVRDPDGGEPIAVLPGVVSPDLVETVGSHRFQVAADGFWQVHPAAGPTLEAAVRRRAESRLSAGDTAWDLYGGVGLFTATLADLVGPQGSVVSVEGDRRASAAARENVGDRATVICGDVAETLAMLSGPVDLVVLDPPRSGAGRAVCDAIAAAGPSTVVYVACDPAALGRDTRTLLDHGYELSDLEAFDCFPQTHHVECVATFTR